MATWPNRDPGLYLVGYRSHTWKPEAEFEGDRNGWGWVFTAAIFTLGAGIGRLK
ncbi:hypothetical protein ACFVX3_31865 [Rhodococcus erythropolis]